MKATGAFRYYSGRHDGIEFQQEMRNTLQKLKTHVDTIQTMDVNIIVDDSCKSNVQSGKINRIWCVKDIITNTSPYDEAQQTGGRRGYVNRVD